MPQDNISDDVAAAYDDMVKLEDDPSQDFALEGNAGEDEPEQDTGGGQPVEADDGEESEAPTSDDSPSSADPKEEAAKPETDAPEAPVHWSAADREMFNKQTPEARDWLMGRYREMEAAHTRRSQEIAPIRNTVSQWAPYLNQVGISPERAFHGLLEIEQRMRTGSNAEKIATIRQLVEEYGVTAPEEGEKTEIDPATLQLRRELNQLRAAQHHSAQSYEQQRMTQAAGQLDGFKNAKTEAGALAHPYYGEVVDTMTGIVRVQMEQGKQPDLEAAYEQACWANPVVRSKITAEQNKAKVAQKRSTGSQISGAGSNRPKVFNSVEEAVEDAWNRVAPAA